MKIYKTNIINGLKDLSSHDFQKIAWFENNQGVSSSFSDDVSAIYEDTGLEHALDTNEIIFSAEADNALRDLNETIEAIGYDRDEAELIDSSDMHMVSKKAAQALALIIKSDGQDSTVEIAG